MKINSNSVTFKISSHFCCYRFFPFESKICIRARDSASKRANPDHHSKTLLTGLRYELTMNLMKDLKEINHSESTNLQK